MSKRRIEIALDRRGKVSAVVISAGCSRDAEIVKGTLAKVVHRGAWAWMQELVETRLVAQQEPAGTTNAEGVA